MVIINRFDNNTRTLNNSMSISESINTNVKPFIQHYCTNQKVHYTTVMENVTIDNIVIIIKLEIQSLSKK